jgi:hypothetical protein
MLGVLFCDDDGGIFNQKLLQANRNHYGQVQCSLCNWQGRELGPQSLPDVWANALETNNATARIVLRTSRTMVFPSLNDNAK